MVWTSDSFMFTAFISGNDRRCVGVSCECRDGWIAHFLSSTCSWTLWANNWLTWLIWNQSAERWNAFIPVYLSAHLSVCLFDPTVCLQLLLCDLHQDVVLKYVKRMIEDAKKINSFFSEEVRQVHPHIGVLTTRLSQLVHSSVSNTVLVLQYC